MDTRWQKPNRAEVRDVAEVRISSVLLGSAELLESPWNNSGYFGNLCLYTLPVNPVHVR